MKKKHFSFSARQHRRLWRRLGELAEQYWEHAADERTPVLERRGRPRARGLPPRGRPAERVQREAARYLSQNACHLASPRYYGLMNPKPAPAAVLGDALASVL
ncbi:MAG: hypothetical protein V3R29_00850, partial [Candidatus Acidoferrales bacterium]